MKCAMEVLTERKIVEEKRKNEIRNKYLEKYLTFREELNTRIENAFIYGKNSFSIILVESFDGVFFEANMQYRNNRLYDVRREYDKPLFIEDYQKYLESFCYKSKLTMTKDITYSCSGKTYSEVIYYLFTVSIDPKCLAN